MRLVPLILKLLGLLTVALLLVFILPSLPINAPSSLMVLGILFLGIGLSWPAFLKNMMAGITILWDQPIQVGDFIQLDKLAGTVEKITLRTTMIRTIHHVCVLIPNHHVVQKTLINWSYQDGQCRLKIPVSFPDESDRILITEALIAAAVREPNVLKCPAPHLWFNGFGDGSIHLELLVWINTPAKIEVIRSSLYFLIDDELQARKLTPATSPSRGTPGSIANVLPTPKTTPPVTKTVESPHLLSSKLSRQTDETEILPQVQQAKILPEIVSSSVAPAPLLSLKTIALRDLLRQVSHFKTLSDFELRYLVEGGYCRKLDASEVLFNEGDRGDAFYLILSGAVEVYTSNGEQKLATLEANQFFGELSLLLGITRTASIRAIVPTNLFVIHQEGFERLVQAHPTLKEAIVNELIQRQDEFEQRQP